MTLKEEIRKSIADVFCCEWEQVANELKTESSWTLVPSSSSKPNLSIQGFAHGELWIELDLAKLVSELHKNDIWNDDPRPMIDAAKACERYAKLFRSAAAKAEKS